MHFTHCPAADRLLHCPDGWRHHTWTDANLGPDSRGSRKRIRVAYRAMRRAGLSPADTRGILWDAFAAGTRGRLVDHDLRY